MRLRLTVLTLMVSFATLFGACGDTAPTCDLEACESSNRLCSTSVASCGECLAGFVEIDGDCILASDSCEECSSIHRSCLTENGADGSLCGECLDGFYHSSDLGEAGGACVAWTECDFANEFELFRPTAKRDRRCRDLTVCEEEQYEDKGPTQTSDRECRWITDCYFPDEFEAAPPRETSDRICLNVTNCELGITFETLSATPTSDRVCTPVRTCAPHEAVSLEATLTADLLCKSCDWSSQYLDRSGPGEAQCATRSAACPAGYGYADSTLADRRSDCEDPCPDGTFNDGSSRVCSPHKTCNSVTELALSRGTASADWICQSFADIMVRIPAGTFAMGAPADDVFTHSNERPQHQVTLTRDFYMSNTEVTVELYHFVMYGSTDGATEALDLPVDSIMRVDAAHFVNRLSDAAGLERCYSSNGDVYHESIYDCSGYRLPTEAEWEYAARGDITGIRIPNIEIFAWYSANSEGSKKTVATKPPNSYGLYDMIGNVSEWVSDTYVGYTEDAVSDPFIYRTSYVNPYMYRGARYDSEEYGVDRVTLRYGLKFDAAYKGVGIRFVRTVPQ